MKAIHLLLSVIFICASIVFAKTEDAQANKAQTKEELIEEVIELSNAESEFAEATSRTLESLQQVYGKDDEKLEAAREYCRKNSIKPIYASALNETFNEDELKTLIKYYKYMPPEYKPVLRKLGVDFRMNYALETSEWTQGLLDELRASTSTNSNEKLNSNQKLDPTVKTPVESGKVQGTAGQL